MLHSIQNTVPRTIPNMIAGVDWMLRRAPPVLAKCWTKNHRRSTVLANTMMIRFTRSSGAANQVRAASWPIGWVVGLAVPESAMVDRLPGAVGFLG
jgi:hypothetical protein